MKIKLNRFLYHSKRVVLSVWTISTWFSGSDVTGRRYRLVDSDVFLGSLRLEETTEIQANSSYHGIIVYCSSFLVLRKP